MKLQAVFFGLLLTFATVTRVSAQIVTTTYDSIPIDSVFVDYQSTSMYLDSIQGFPDQKQAHLGDADFFSVQFAVNHQVVTMEKGAQMQVYWSRVSSDSCAAVIQFGYFDYSNPGPPNGPVDTVYEGGPLNVWNMTTLTVPDTGFNALQIGVDVNGNAGQPGADSCFIDAIVLVQTGSVTASVAQNAGSAGPVLMNYPNPFYHSMGTRVQVHAPVAGIGLLSITDALGREVARVPLGALNEGDLETNITLERAGIFFVRLYVNGTPTGSPLEISSQ
jgi:hypothetical protein